MKSKRRLIKKVFVSLLVLIAIAFLLKTLNESTKFRAVDNNFQIDGFPNYFKDTAMIHIRELCSFGERKSGTEAEQNAIKYIYKQLLNIGLEVQIDTFEYKKGTKFYKSFNVIGTLNGNSKEEIIISAHWDCIKGSGAHDNASGISVLIELARYFKESNIDYTIKFLATGAEEDGWIGATAYTSKYKDELESCKFIFNMDAIGGTSSSVYIDDGEIKKVPNWLKQTLIETKKTLKYNIKFVGGAGSDHNAFHRAGVVATNICIPGNVKSHSEEDTYDKINSNSLEKAGKIVALAVLNSIK